MVSSPLVLAETSSANLLAATVISELSGSGVDSVRVSALANEADSMVAAASRARMEKCFISVLPVDIHKSD
ncbi:hypothetical protein D3C87_2108140 [compost metagenome]